MEIAVGDSLKRTLGMFVANNTAAWGQETSEIEIEAKRLKLKTKILSEYKAVKDLPPPSSSTTGKPPITIPSALGPLGIHPSKPSTNGEIEIRGPHPYPSVPGVQITEAEKEEDEVNVVKDILTSKAMENERQAHGVMAIVAHAKQPERFMPPSTTRALVPITPVSYEKPTWHAPWKLMRVISGHVGWVRSIAVDPSNEWFVTGSADKTIKIWDMASGVLKLTLTGHISTVRGLAVSERHPYLFSAGEDKQVRCWDLEYNKTIRNYHGHLSGVHSIAIHPTIDVLITGGRDATARVWDMRTKQQIHVLGGHEDIVGSILTQPTDPQIITASYDKTVRLWDLAAGKSIATLTHHKKSVRALAQHPTEYTFMSGGADNLKKWLLPEGKFLQNLSGHNAVVNTLAVSRDGVVISGADNGTLCAWDWRSGYLYQRFQTTPQPGSLESEAGILGSTFDRSGARYITCEVDKTIKMWKEDEDATPETHPVSADWKMLQQHNKRW